MISAGIYLRQVNEFNCKDITFIALRYAYLFTAHC